MRKPVILFSVLYAKPSLGGAEISMFNYFRRLSKYYDIYAMCFMQGDRKFYARNEFIEDGIHVIQTPQPVDMAVHSFIFNHKPDLIITQLLTSDIVVNEAYKNDIPVIYFAHGIFEDVCFGYLRQDCPYDDVLTCPHDINCKYADDIARHSLKYKNCDHIVCNSEYTRDVFLKVFPETADKLSIVNPDFNYDIFQYEEKRKEDRIRVLAVNSSPLKGRNTVFDVAFNNQNMEFFYVDCRDCDHNFLARSPNIHLLGKIKREELADLYHNVNVTVIPTVMQETFSGVACESILSGTPVVSTQKGNLVKLVKDGISGYTLHDLDVNEWTEKIRLAAAMSVDKDYSDKLRKSLDSVGNTAKIKGYIDSLIRKYQEESVFATKDHFSLLYSKKILFFAKICSPPLGGGEYFIHSVLTYLKEKGYECLAACYCHPDPRQKLKNEVIDWMGLEVHRFESMSYDICSNFFKEQKPDLVITQSFDAPGIVAAANRLGIKTILGTHFWRNICDIEGNFVNMLERPLSTVKLRKDLHPVFKEADMLYVNSEYMRKAVKRYVGVDIERIISPVLDRDRVIAKNINREYVTIINPDHGKGGRLFVELAKQMPDIKFACVGLGNDCFAENAKINREIKGIGNIKLIEHTDNMSEVYGIASVLLVPSMVDETFSMVTLEAMANGIPVIASGYGNLPFLIGANNGGFILDPTDIFLWQEKIRQLMEDKELYNRCSEGVLNRSKDFDPEIQLEKFYKMVVECIGA